MIINEFYACQRENPEAERLNIIRAAAKLIKEDIKSVAAMNTAYPPISKMALIQEALDYLPETLRV